MSPKKEARFTDAERAAMKERAQELTAEARRTPRAKKAAGESDVLAKIAEVWPVAFALKELTAADEVRIGALVKKAVS